MNFKKVWLGVLAAVVATAAYAGIIVHGQLIDASAENLSADPTAYTGRFYLNTTGHTLKFYTGSAWRTIVDTTTALSNPLTTTGDIMYSSDNSGTPARLAIGASTTVLHGGTTPAYSQVVNADVSGSAAIAGSKLAGIAQATAGVDTSAAQRLGTNTNDAASAGNIGELLEANGNVAPTSVDVYKTQASVTLTAGQWVVCANAGFSIGSATTVTQVGCVISGTADSGTNLSGTDQGVANMTFASGSFSFGSPRLACGCLFYKVANGATQAAKVNCAAQYASLGTGACLGSISALRVR